MEHTEEWKTRSERLNWMTNSEITDLVMDLEAQVKSLSDLLARKEAKIDKLYENLNDVERENRSLLKEINKYSKELADYLEHNWLEIAKGLKEFETKHKELFS